MELGTRWEHVGNTFVKLILGDVCKDTIYP